MSLHCVNGIHQNNSIKIEMETDKVHTLNLYLRLLAAKHIL